MPALDRFEARIDRNGPVPDYRPDLGPCWVWGGAKDTGGYGRFMADGRVVGTHRWAYEQWVGTIPEGLEIDHLCRNRACANPAHLEPVTRRENLRRSPIWGTQRTHCVKGHAFTEDNTYHYRGQRVCKACTTEWVRAWRQKVAARKQPNDCAPNRNRLYLGIALAEPVVEQMRQGC